MRLQEDGDAARDEEFSWVGVSQALGGPKVYLSCLCLRTMSLPVYIINLFLPAIINDPGYTTAQAQLLSVPPYAFDFVATICVASP